MICGIYAILNIINGKYYIGSALDFFDRWRLHKLELNRNNHHNRHLQKSWLKYGAHNFMFVVIEYTDWLDAREQYWIKELDATNIEKGYNICLFLRNRTGVKISEETRKRLSESHKGHKQSEETKAKRAVIMTGNQHSKGSKRSKEHLDAMRKGRKYLPETAAKISAANKGRIVSAETREKMRQAKLGRKHTEAAKANMCGHIISEETRLKLSLAAKAQWQNQKTVDKPLDYSCDMWL